MGEYSPVFSPDGSKIAFGGSVNSDSHIYVMNADGSNRVQVTHNTVGDGAPSWQPIPSGYSRPKGASPMRVSLVPAANACTSPNRTHGAPLAFPSCSPPQSASQNLTIGVGDGTPPQAKSIGSLLAVVHPGAPGPPNDSDVSLSLSIGNVYQRSDLSDYTGELEARAMVRLTDKEGAIVGTTADFPFSFTAPCSATADTTLGASCAVATSANAVLPGSIVDGGRAIWALDQVQVYDGGSDGDVDTPGNSLFEVQGMFVP
jgi:hypothetical protein